MTRKNRYPENPHPPNSLDAALYDLSRACQPLKETFTGSDGSLLAWFLTVYVALVGGALTIEFLL